VCVIAGNHDEALSYDGVRFASTVSPSDFSESSMPIARTSGSSARQARGAADRARARRALFFPDGLLVAHGGFPLVDLHAQLPRRVTGTNPGASRISCGRALIRRARRKMPNRHSRGSQFGYEDFADFCALSARPRATGDAHGARP
jgi:hypothetical protein